MLNDHSAQLSFDFREAATEKIKDLKEKNPANYGKPYIFFKEADLYKTPNKDFENVIHNQNKK